MIARSVLSLVIPAVLVCLGQNHQLPLRLTSEQRSAALETIKGRLMEKHVFPEAGSKIVKTPIRSQWSGRHDVENPYVFAGCISEDIRSAGTIITFALQPTRRRPLPHWNRQRAMTGWAPSNTAWQYIITMDRPPGLA